MSDKVKPALTAEEWAEIRRDGGELDLNIQARPLAVAAVLLHDNGPEPGKPLFTWDDVDDIRAELYDAVDEPTWTAIERGDRLNSLIDRIAALLPPRETKP